MRPGIASKVCTLVLFIVLEISFGPSEPHLPYSEHGGKYILRSLLTDYYFDAVIGELMCCSLVMLAN